MANWYDLPMTGLGGQPAGTPTPPFRQGGGGPEPPRGPVGPEPNRFYPGQIERGNIDLMARPTVVNPDGSVSTVRSMGINVNGQEVLIPTVHDSGYVMSDEEARREFERTGRHLGKFDSVDASNAAAAGIHSEQEAMGSDEGYYGGPPKPRRQGRRQGRKRRPVP